MRRMLLLGSAIAVVACSENKGTEVKRGNGTRADSADQVLFGVQAPMEVGGVRRGTLYADTMYVMNDMTRFDFVRGHADFNTELGARTGSMKADRGRYDQRRQYLEGWGHVVLTMKDGRKLSSPHLIFDQMKNEISSDTTYEGIEAGGRRSTGIGFTSDPDFLHPRCFRACVVSGAVKIPK